MAKKVSFGKRDNNGMPKIEEIDSDVNHIDLTRAGKANKTSTVNGTADEPILKSLEPSFVVIPWHLPLALYSVMVNDRLYHDTRTALQQGFYGLSVLSLIYAVLLNEKVKLANGVKTVGPNGKELLYVSLTFPLSVLLAIPLYFIMVLLGAPLSGGLNALSFYLAAHVSVIAFVPLFNCYKFTSTNAKTKWWKLLTFQVPSWYRNQIYCMTLGALWGCWLGVAPTPLDWDREWQAWPITLLIGSYLGAFFGSLLSYIYAKLRS